MDSAIATAMDLFQQRGYDGVGIAELSQAIGIAAPSLYAAFGNKRSLFEQVLARYVTLNSRWLLEALALEDKLEVVFTNLFVAAANTYSTDPTRPGCLVLDGTRNCCNEAQELTEKYRQNTWQLVCDRIQTSAPKLSDAALNELSDYVLMVLIGLSGSARDGLSPERLSVAAQTAALGFSQRLFMLEN